MFTVIEKILLNKTMVKITIHAPFIAEKIKAGQFVILRIDEHGERVPFTVAAADVENGTIAIVFQVIGATTLQMSTLEKGDALHDVVGPLGKATVLTHIKKAAVIGGGSGCAIAYPVAKALRENGAEVHAILGFRDKSLVMMQDDFDKISSKVALMTDDGTAGEQGLVTDALKKWLDAGEQYDEIFAIGPLPMMKFVCKLTAQYGQKTTVSMNSIMIDGTGMCGCCRLTVGGETKFACVDGPDFDGHLVDFDEAISRMNIYAPFEKEAYDHTCNLLKQGGTQ